MKSKEEIEIFLNEKINGLRKELIEFIFQEDDDNIVEKSENITAMKNISDTDKFIDFRYPFETDEEKFTIRFSKGNRCISAYYNYELIFDGNISTYNRYYMGREISKKYDVSKSKGKDIRFNGSICFLSKKIAEKIPAKSAINATKINNFLTDTVKPYLIENVFFKYEK